MADVERICGQLKDSGEYCDKPLGECPWHDPPGPSVDVDALLDSLEDALDYHGAGDHAYAEKFVRRARELL